MSSSESNAVKWLPMGEIGEFIRGNGLQKKDFIDSGVGCIHYGEIYTYYGTSATETKSFVSEELAKQLKKAHHGDLVIATTSENVEDLCKAVAWLGKDEICIGGHSCLFRHNQNPKFLTYLTQTSLFSSYKRRYGQGVKVVEMSCKKLETFELPIPPLAEQARIVSILDKYSSIKDQLTKQLDLEIELTLKQYEYYRDDLLSFKDSDTKWLAMGDIGDFIRGNGLQKKDFIESGVGCIHYGEIYTYYGTSATETKSFVSEELALKLKKAKQGDLVIATTSENVDDVCKAVAWMGQDDICISGDSHLFKHNQHPKYLAYMFQTQLFSSYKQRVATGTKVMRVSAANMSKFQLPIPSLEEQERIVSILDKYSESVDKLVSNIRREKELVQKQYEYYREKLLTF